jgi:hypothetical protein
MLCLGWRHSRAKCPHLPAVEAWKVVGEKLLWWPNGSLLWRWSTSTVELLLLLLLLLRLELPLLVMRAIAPILLLLLRSVQLTPRWDIHYAVLRRSTARTTTDRASRQHPLPLLLISLSNGLHQPLLINGSTRQFILCQASELTQALLQVNGKSFTVQVGLLLIHIDMI